MCCLTSFCVVCLKKEEQYHTILKTNCDDAQLLYKLHTCTFMTDFLHTDASLPICNKCYDTLEIAYEFIDMCHKNSAILRGCIKQLSHVRASTSHEIEFIALNDIKLENVDECTEEVIENFEPEPNVASNDLTLNIVKQKEEEGSTNKEEKNINDKEESNNEDEECNNVEEGTILKKVEQCTIKEEIHSLDEDYNIKEGQMSGMADVGTIDDQEAVESMNTDNESLSDDELVKNKCKICGKTFDCRSKLIRHKLIHLGEKQYECTMCDKKYSNNWNLKRHILDHTEENSSQCHICQKRFLHSYTLKRHMLIHTGEKNFSCRVCQKRFTRANNVKMHMRIHNGEKKYKCNICEKSFIEAKSLTIHTRIHTGEKKYECSICQKRFTQSSHLTVHALIHTGEKNYQCTLCEKRFALSSSFKRHMRVHARKAKQ